MHLTYAHYRVHTHLVVSTLYETLVFAFSEKDVITHLDPATIGFTTNLSTFALGNIPRRQTAMNGGRSTSSYVDSALIVQITPEGVQLVEYDAALSTFSNTGSGWYPKQLGSDYNGREVVAAAMSSSQYVAGLSRGRLVLLNLGQGDDLQVVKCDKICAFHVAHI